MVKPKIYVNGDIERGRVFLTSGFQAPFQEDNIIEQIDVNSHFQSYSTGGSIFHVFTGETLTPEEQEKLIFSIIKKFPIQYMTKTPVMSMCNNCGKKIVGRVNVCPECGSDDVSVWSRPIGYYRPVMRKKINKEFDNADYTFWMKNRIEDFRTRKSVLKKDINYMIEELGNGV